MATKFTFIYKVQSIYKNKRHKVVDCISQDVAETLQTFFFVNVKVQIVTFVDQLKVMT